MAAAMTAVWASSMGGPKRCYGRSNSKRPETTTISQLPEIASGTFSFVGCCLLRQNKKKIPLAALKFDRDYRGR